jgi:hypothetical protein
LALNLPVWWALASGVALAALGLAMLRVRPRPGPNVLFAGFCLAWGAEIVTANLGVLVLPDVRAGALFLRLSLAFYLPTSVFLAYFVTLYPRPPSSRVALAGPAAFVLVALAGVAAFIAAPDLLFRGLREFANGGFAPLYGPAANPLVIMPFFAAFDFAALWLLLVYQRSRQVARQQARLLLAGMLLFVSYVNVQTLAFVLLFPGFLDPLTSTGFLVLFGSGVALSAGIAVRLAFPRTTEGRDPLLLACAVVPGVVAAIEQVLIATAGTFWLSSLGFWRFGTVALIAYGIARYQLFDLDVRLRGFSRRALPLVAAFVAGAFILTVAEPQGLAVALPVAAIAAAPAGLAAWRWREPAARALFPAEAADPEYLYHRKLEVYHASLARLLAEDAAATVEHVELRQLRKSLGLSEREHQVLEFMVRQTLGRTGQPGQPPRVAPGAVLLGRYRVERLLGEGAHGRAYLARDATLQREVVVKAVGTHALGGKAARMLLREARLAGSLRHPNVVAIHDVQEGPDEAIIVMEYADGGSLFGLLRRRGRLGMPEASDVLEQVLAGLEAAHAKGIVHRDIKPENILLTRSGVVKLADFGVARDVRPDATGVTQGPMGTLLYMAPEQVRGLEVDARADLYAAAVVFHQALTGRFYLRIAGKDDFQVRQLILRGAPRLDLAGQPAWVEGFLAKALAKDPAKRFASAAEMRRALRRPAREATKPA